MSNDSDFDKPWCKEILSDPSVEYPKNAHERSQNAGTNTMFQYTLNTDRGIRAFLSFRRRCKEPDSIFTWEDCFLLSVGDGVDGAKGRAHGGFNSLILDHLCGHCASQALENDPNPATATLTTDYKAPVSTPCVIFAHAWVIELSGRKVWVRAIIQDGDGKVLAMGKSLFIKTPDHKL